MDKTDKESLKNISFKPLLKYCLYLSLLVVILAGIWLAIVFLPFSSKTRQTIDQINLELGRELMFIPSYLFPFPEKEYEIDLSGKQVKVGYGFIKSLSLTAKRPAEGQFAQPKVETNLTIRRVFSNKTISFNQNQLDFDNLKLAFFYVRGDIFLPSGAYLEEEAILERSRFITKNKPVLASFVGDISSLAVGDFVRYYYDKDNNLVRLDLIDVGI